MGQICSVFSQYFLERIIYSLKLDTNTLTGSVVFCRLVGWSGSLAGSLVVAVGSFFFVPELS